MINKHSNFVVINKINNHTLEIKVKLKEEKTNSKRYYVFVKSNYIGTIIEEDVISDGKEVHNKFFIVKGNLFNIDDVLYNKAMVFKKLFDFIFKEGKIPNNVNICIDVPNGYLEKFVKFCAKVRDLHPNSIILAGNVCTSEMTQELIIHGGVDIVKLFIGPGLACRTRMVTGVGYPTLTSTIECSSVAHGLKKAPKRLGLVCADGGFRQYGDICKGFVAGADFCMSGFLFAGTKETGCSITEHNGTKYCEYYGLSSHYSQQKHGEGYKEYRASEGSIQKVKYKGEIESIIKEMLGGIRSCCTLIGSDSIKDMNKCGNFIVCNRIHEKSHELIESGI